MCFNLIYCCNLENRIFAKRKSITTNKATDIIISIKNVNAPTATHKSILNSILFMEEIKLWSAYDFNYLLQKIESVERKVGLESVINLECPKCHNAFDTTFRYTEEFFRPHID